MTERSGTVVTLVLGVIALAGVVGSIVLAASDAVMPGEAIASSAGAATAIPARWAKSPREVDQQ